MHRYLFILTMFVMSISGCSAYWVSNVTPSVDTVVGTTTYKNHPCHIYVMDIKSNGLDADVTARVELVNNTGSNLYATSVCFFYNVSKQMEHKTVVVNDVRVSKYTTIMLNVKTAMYIKNVHSARTYCVIKWKTTKNTK